MSTITVAVSQKTWIEADVDVDVAKIIDNASAADIKRLMEAAASKGLASFCQGLGPGDGDDSRVRRIIEDAERALHARDPARTCRPVLARAREGAGMKYFPNLAARLAGFLLVRVAGARDPDFIVGADHPHGPYLNRWFLTPWRRWQRRLGNRADAHPTTWNRLLARLARLLPNAYLHQFLRDDDDRALHDHPSCGWSLLLVGSYVEHTIDAGGIHRRTTYVAGDFRFMAVRHAHRIELARGADGRALPCFTLFSFGPTVREWGFHCPEQGWVHWKKFTAAGQPGEIGPGCDA